MTNEAVIVELQAGMNAVDFTVANGIGISKGSLMSGGQIGTSRTAVKSSADNVGNFVGITAAEKEADDGAINVALHQVGIFDLVATEGAAIAMGDKVRLSGANLITGIPASQTISGGAIIVGTAQESTAAGVTETIEVDIGNR